MLVGIAWSGLVWIAIHLLRVSFGRLNTIPVSVTLEDDEEGRWMIKAMGQQLSSIGNEMDGKETAC